MTYLNDVKEYHKKMDQEILLFDIGDFIDRANPMTEATLGKGNIPLLNAIGYDNITIGNNEGITLSKEELDSLYDHAECQVLVANLFHPNGNRPDWMKPYQIHQLTNGLRIGVIGLTVFFERFYELLDWKVVDPFSVLPEIVEEVQQKSDAIILLSHLGISDDEYIASNIKGIDVILGGHTHHLLKNGKQIGETLLSAAGKHGKYIGEVILTFDGKTKELLKKESSAISLDHYKESKESVSYLHQLYESSLDKLDETITELKEPLTLHWYQASESTTILATALKEWCDAEIGMVNAGVLLEDLPKGRVTKGDLHRICPHPINPCKVTLRGDELKEVILQAFTDKMQRLELKGLGFRGKVLGQMIFDGVKVQLKTLDDGLSHVAKIEVLGEELNPNRKYSVATLDMFTFGFLYPEISHAKDKKYYLPEMLRDVFAWKLKRMEQS